MLASQIFLIIAGVLLFARRPNTLRGLPLLCPITSIVLGLGVILLSIASF